MKSWLLVVVGLCTCVPGMAQVYTAGTIAFVNAGPYAKADLESVAGIHPGTKFTADDLSVSAQKLADTGLFDDVTASLLGRFSAMTVTYELKPLAQESLLHVEFQNFVWLTHAEIEAAVRAKLPLFSDYLPEGSPDEDVIRAALGEALKAKGVDASVVYDTEEPSLEHPVREIAFRVSKPFVQVANVKLGGVTPELVPYVQKSVNQTARKPYLEVPPGLSTADQILAPLLDSGYLQASLSGVQVTPAADQNGVTGVVVSATLDPHEIYKVSTISFAGSPLLSADQFAAGAKLHPGDVASHSALLETLKPLDAAYRRQGYMDVTVEAKPTLNGEAHEVSYAVSVSPGEQYRINEVSTENLDPEAKAAFEKVFLMKKGELYNPEYVAEFLKNNSSVKVFAPYVGNYVAYAHPKTHTVELVVTFARR